MFQSLARLPDDPILGLMSLFREDPRDHKVDLGVGVYKNESGETPVMAAVRKAEQQLLSQQASKSYVGPAGRPEFNQLMAELVLGKHPALTNGCLALAQTPGGCGALRVAAELVKVSGGTRRVWVSDPTWGNHIPLLGNCGLAIKSYPYYSTERKCVDFDAMLDVLSGVEQGDLVLLHGACHNPTGADLTLEQWAEIGRLAQDRGFVPFVDLAYQGFGEGIDADAAGLRILAEMLPELVVAVSCSKSFGLYRERVGLAMVLCQSEASAAAARSHMLSIVRGIYSMPPDHGAAIVAEILGHRDLKAEWAGELDQMRYRINQLRVDFSTAMRQRIGGDHFDFVQEQKGMFSFLGLSELQVARLRDEFAVYMLSSSRTNIVGFNQTNLPYVCDAVAYIYGDSML